MCGQSRVASRIEKGKKKKKVGVFTLERGLGTRFSTSTNAISHTHMFSVSLILETFNKSMQ